MTLPYENSTVGKKALLDIEKNLRNFGCTKFASGEDYESGEIFIQFERLGKLINMKASPKGYAAAWLEQNPWNGRRRGSYAEHKERAIKIGNTAIYSVLRDAIKSQLVLVEIGVKRFEEVFLADIMLPSGQRIIEFCDSENLLPAPEEGE